MLSANINSEQTKALLLNRHCVCLTLDQSTVAQKLAKELPNERDQILSITAWQQFFSNTAVFVPDHEMGLMQSIVHAIEAVVALPKYRSSALSWAPENAQVDPGPSGAFMGYDFHLGADGPRLIEVNTNAGGAFLNAVMRHVQIQCCGASTRMSGAESFDSAVVAQFDSEWRAQRGSGRPKTIAIVDEQPAEQHLYPEFRLAQQLLRNNGFDALILSPSDLRYEGGALYSGDKQIDMVYNRLVDFGLQAPEQAALRSAWLDGSAVITPNPFVHALRADKRNLALLSDRDTLLDWGLSREHSEFLQHGVPRTVQVNATNADELWQQRKQLFFKPVAGHGSKGVYRGSKLTKGTFARILDSDYIAQAYVPPSERVVLVDGEQQMLKVDVRLYTYKGAVLLAAARLYQGQTTNFRTPGGGFAPLLLLNSAE
ncbi:hypothetical protein LCGC14_0006740 [marine sediment metagenome]|uniref:ATP-grasp domain-containing protein n=1 Tax=marine sediment metagenome TaxID=412755 RepID=A0A0F9WJD0_9ZZZZ|nr:hypothetical protein [Pseudohongiella sp.]HEA61833.1 hypothetical protein [Pseudohongiella sp.]